MPSYVDAERGLISREIFVDEDVYRLEQERIFCTQWLFIGHASQVPQAGDYFTSRMGEESVIMVRGKDGEIRVLLNSCRHRGMKVCRYDEGNTPIFTCPYHGWSYSLSGELIGVPRFKDAYHGELDRSQYGMLEARACNHRGMIWATWNATGPDFYEFMGDMLQFHDSMLEPADGGDGEVEVLPGVQKWIVPCNWKFPCENNIGDLYHGVSHVSVEMVGIGPGGRGSRRQGDGGYRQLAITAFPKTGHGGRGGLANPGAVARYPFPAFSDPATEAWHRAAWERHTENRPGERPAWDRLGSGGNVFPNMSFTRVGRVRSWSRIRRSHQHRDVALVHGRQGYADRREALHAGILLALLRSRRRAPNRTTWRTGPTRRSRAKARWLASCRTICSKGWGAPKIRSAAQRRPLCGRLRFRKQRDGVLQPLAGADGMNRFVLFLFAALGLLTASAPAQTLIPIRVSATPIDLNGPVFTHKIWAISSRPG